MSPTIEPKYVASERELVEDRSIPDDILPGMPNWRHALWLARGGGQRNPIRAAIILRHVREWKYPDLED